MKGRQKKEIEVGEWIRTQDGQIGKNNSNYNWNLEETYINDSPVVKHSKNIIDLVEAGDYVNGHRVTESKYKQYDKYYFIDIDCNDISFGWGIGVIPVDEIKSIVTHEQFASIEYKLEEDKDEK